MSHSSMTAIERRAVVSLAMVYAFRMLGLFSLLPVLALYADEYQFSTPVLVGLALGIYGLGQACLQLPMGMLSDRIGRKPVIIFGLLLFVAGGVLAASADNIFLIIFGRLLQGAGAIASTLTALLADLTREEHRSKAMAAIGGSIGIAFALAMILGPAIAAGVGLSGLFLVTSGLAFASILLVIFLVPSPPRQYSDADAQAMTGLLGRCLRDPQLMRLNVGIFVLHGILMAIFVVVPGLLEQQGLVAASHWQVYLPVMGLAFVLMLPLMIVAEKQGKSKAVFLLSIGGLVVSMFFASLVWANFWGVVLVLLVFFIGFNLLEASLPSLVSKMVYPGGKGTAMGVYSTFQFMGAFCGGVLGGWLVGHWGGAVVFVAAGLVALVWLLLAWGMTLPAASKSLVIAWQFGEWDASRLRGELMVLTGAIELTVLEKEQTAYFRVSDAFDRTQLPQGLEWRA
ncbi:MFS transporter [Spongiibacter sp. IMCC21906]|uniref:MFS transporter n=1 Tax=Spongiibacter sp. IMCC21906 TaxID=1620392 RepID=UPI001E321DCF|nr:MFS transporter [Spongiibacter sp. IMCC21906]